LVVSVSPDPDLVEACALMSMLPIAVQSSLNTVSLRPSIPVVADGVTLMYPPALK
jgi:hypothetical protein